MGKRLNYADAATMGAMSVRGKKPLTTEPMGGSNLIPANVILPDAVSINEVQVMRSRGVARAANNSPISLNITRETNNILADLPFCLFAYDNKDENYATIFRNTNTTPQIAGVFGTVVFSIDSNGDGLFTWTLGGFTDVIRIHSTKPVSYANQLTKSNNGGFISSGIRYKAMTANFEDQFDTFDIFHGETFFKGPIDFDNTTVDSQKGPNQFQDARVDVPIELAIDSARFILCGFPNDVANSPNSIKWSFFDVEFYSPSMFGG